MFRHVEAQIFQVIYTTASVESPFMGWGAKINSSAEAVPDLRLLKLLMSSLNIFSAGVSQRLTSILKPLTQVWPNDMDFISLIQLEPAPVQEHE